VNLNSALYGRQFNFELKTESNLEKMN
jgi:hypothetical protein